ncbi:hypothetical protein [Muriicola marianensis]|uniref:Selenophosphate synthetase n=1 Tax=Muriicola marianensis TaxID=1324801 RepID=A0ABQ1QVT2_9FLAO|nr:hypothetical protein [Muriicola marianensis]GGD44649.1 hypothetical protein GCM10011361_09520 [Muriicola marianensis]
MKKHLYLLVFIVLMIGCKSETKKVTPEKDLTIIEKVAAAHGVENWNKVREIRFTFNVDRDTMHFERTWVWDTRSQEVTGISRGDTVKYNRRKVDSLSQKADGAFINDKYWLLAPINISWDEENLTYSVEEKVPAPISNDTLTKLTVVYGNEGGYTPGDAYDFYLGDNYLVREWVFRRSNSPEPSSVSTWEGYKELSGLNISTMHKNKDGNFSLYFTDVEVLQ